MPNFVFYLVFIAYCFLYSPFWITTPPNSDEAIQLQNIQGGTDEKMSSRQQDADIVGPPPPYRSYRNQRYPAIPLFYMAPAYEGLDSGSVLGWY